MSRGSAVSLCIAVFGVICWASSLGHSGPLALSSGTGFISKTTDYTQLFEKSLQTLNAALSDLPEKFGEPVSDMARQTEAQAHVVSSYLSSDGVQAESRDRVLDYSRNVCKASSRLSDIEGEFIGFCRYVSKTLDADQQILDQAKTMDKDHRNEFYKGAHEMLIEVVKESLHQLHKLMDKLGDVKENLAALNSDVDMITKFLKDDLKEYAETHNPDARKRAADVACVFDAGMSLLSPVNALAAVNECMEAYDRNMNAETYESMNDRAQSKLKGLQTAFKKLSERTTGLVAEAKDYMRSMELVESDLNAERSALRGLSNPEVWVAIISSFNNKTIEDMQNFLSSHAIDA